MVLIKLNVYEMFNGVCLLYYFTYICAGIGIINV